MRLLYFLLICLLTPVLLLYFAARGLKDRGWWQRWGERFGHSDHRFNARGIIVHAASVGEVNAAAPLIRSILQRWPDHPLTVTCFTPTGSRRIRTLFGDSIHHVYIPIDLPGATRRFLKRLDPRLLIVMETEIWPSLYQQASRNNIPIMISNARLTPRSADGWSRFPALAGAALSCTSLIATQTEGDQQRFIALGANADTTRVFGNLKFDIELPLDWRSRRKHLRNRWGPDRTVLVAGSTHQTDERALFSAFAKILDQDATALLVVAPRYPERFEQVTGSAESRGFQVRKLSEGIVDTNTQCLVIDQMGVLLDYYAAADITFIGGTLAQVGGHNPLEAAALGRAMILGPNTGHIEQQTRQLLAAGAAIQVNDSNALFDAWSSLQINPERRNEMGQAARLLVEQERGALNRNLEAVSALLTEG